MVRQHRVRWQHEQRRWLLVSAVLWGAWAISITAMAGELPKTPILRIETGMHTARINKIDVDAEYRYLVTASEDKTVRVWALATGKLLRTLRPPIGDGREGKLMAVAISPDSRTIATGGSTGCDADERCAIYLFDRESGRLVRRISGLPNVIFHLAYSKDGRFLVATLGGPHGIRLYHTVDTSLAAEDRGYGAASHGANFDATGRLVTSSLDGMLRLYTVGITPAKALRPSATQKAPGGKRPFGVKFSPDGSAIAVGFSDSPKVDVLSGQDLSYRYSPDTSGVGNGSLFAVTWSSDGKALYAGGTYNVEGTYLIRKWSDAGKGPYRDLPATGNTITHLVSLKTPDMAFSAAGPAFGVFDAQERKSISQGSSVVDYRRTHSRFLLSPDGTTVQFGTAGLGTPSAQFSMGRRLLEPAPARPSTLAPPRIAIADLPVTDWDNTSAPKLRGTILPLDQHEWSQSLAIAPDHQTFLLGTNWSLRLFDWQGALKWRIPTPGVAWGVNISGNGQIAVAALSDGTIRWYRLRDGWELLAFFPHPDRKRWVLWTPKGYYDTSSGGEELLGWHLNNGQDSAAFFFSVSQLRRIYYRPYVVAKVLQTQDEDEARRLADAEAGGERQALQWQQLLPPVVEVESPEDGAEVMSTEVTVQLTVRSPSDQPVIGVKTLVDGRPVEVSREATRVAKEAQGWKMRIPIPQRDAHITFIAENRYATSTPVMVSLKWRGGDTKQDEFVIRPKLYVLSIGVSQYADPALTLQFAAKDARDFATAIDRQKGGLYRDVVLKVLTDKQATKEEILDGLEWLTKETTSKDVAMVFLAGHGVNDSSGVYYFLPANADPQKLKRTGISFSDIKTTVAALAGKTLVFIDTCHAGNVMGARRGVADIMQVVNELAHAENGAVVYASSTGTQYSLEAKEWGNGAFTRALVEGISGRADYMGTGKITTNMLDLYLSERVKELTQGQQTPTTTKPQTISDFPVAVQR